MRNPVKVNSIIGLTIMLSLLVVAPQPSFASCKNSGGSSGSSKVGSQVNGGSVTICASAVAITPARSTTIKTLVKTVQKAPVKTVVKPVATFHKLPAPVAKAPAKAKAPAVKPLAQTKTVAKVISKPSTANKTSAAADFTPAAVNGNVYPSNQLKVGQQASFTSSAVQHFRTGTLLSLATEVRFTPISVAWNFGDGNFVPGNSVGHAFTAAGDNSVQVRVVYAVSYRIKGKLAWIAEPDTITIADDLLVHISENALANPSDTFQSGEASKVLLVGSDCLSNPGTFGCR